MTDTVPAGGKAVVQKILWGFEPSQYAKSFGVFWQPDGGEFEWCEDEQSARWMAKDTGSRLVKRAIVYSRVEYVEEET